MSTAADYLRRVRRHLYGIAPNRRREVMADLRAHFADAEELGLPIDEVIANLGNPDEVAERARVEFGGEVTVAESGWRVLVWAAVTVAAVTATGLLVLFPGSILSDSRAEDLPLGTLVRVAVPAALAALPLLFPRRLRTVATIGSATAVTFACVIGGVDAGAYFAPSSLLLWAALLVWVRLRGDGFGPFWHLGTAVLAVSPAVAAALWAPRLIGAAARYDTDTVDLFSPALWLWVTLGLVALSAVLLAFGIRFAGWMLAAVGAAVMVFAFVAAGDHTLPALLFGGVWLTLGLAHAVSTPARD